MMKAQFYLSIVPEITDDFSDILAITRRAGELGYYGLGIGDHYPTGERPRWRPDPFVALSAIAQAPNVKIKKLGTLALSTSTRHPIVLANCARTLNEISGGQRFFLCLGVGSGKEDEYSRNGFSHVSVKDRLQVLEETLAIIIGLSRRQEDDGDDSFAFEGKHYKIRGAKIFGKDEQDNFPPIWLGERNSSRILSLAGRYADAVNIHCNNPENAKKKLEITRKIAIESGRRKEDIDAVIKHFVILGKDEDIVAEKLGYDELKLDAESRSAFVEREKKENPDTIIGTPDQVRDQYKSYIEAGFDKFTPILLPNTLDKVSEGMELFAKHVL